MSPDRQEEFTTLIERVFALAPVQALQPEPRLLRVHYDWLEAGEVAQRTVARLSEQLRRYLDDQVFLENRRIMRILRDIEQRAIAVRERPPGGAFAEIDESAPEIELPMDRPLFMPPLRPVIDSREVSEADMAVSTDALFDQVHVDLERLAVNLRRTLQTRSQVSLGELLEAHPLQQGLAELIAYFGMATEHRGHVIDDAERQIVMWTDAQCVTRTATVPLVVFQRS